MTRTSAWHNPESNPKVVAEGKTITTPTADKSGEQVQRATCNVDRPEDNETQCLAAIIFAEADASREQDDEREAIAWVVINRRNHNAKFHNDGMGDATIKGVVSAYDPKHGYQFVGYGNKNWNMVMLNNASMVPTDRLKKIEQTTSGRVALKNGGERLSSCESFRRCVEVAKKVNTQGATPSDSRYATFIAYQRADPAKFPMDRRTTDARFDNHSGVRVGMHFFVTWVNGREDPRWKQHKAPKT